MKKSNKIKNNGFLKELKSIKNKNKIKAKNLYRYRDYNLIKCFYFKLFFFIFLFFLMIDTEKENKFIKFFIKDLNNLNNEIIYENNYDVFENTKLMFNNDTFLNYYLKRISILNHTYNNNYKKLKKNKLNIHICISLNNQYIYPILVSMESVLINSDKKNTFLTYHILCAPDVTEKTLTKIKSLMKRYSLNLEMIFYDMGSTFMHLYHTRLKQVAFYRLLLPIMVNLDRIIYLDGDTLTFKDLGEMFQLNFNNNYILGTLDYYSNGVDYLGIKSKKYINSGVLLINLEKIRNDKKYYGLINITRRRSLRNDDQTAINYALFPDIGFLPSKYNIFNFNDISDIKVYRKYIRTEVNITEIEEVLKDPTIIHHVICWPKMWSIHTVYIKEVSSCKQRNDCSCLKYHNIWLSIANKTDYFQDILEFIKK